MLTPRTQRALSWGLEARWLELWNLRSAGYAEDNTKAQRDVLIAAAHEAHKAGAIAYLPRWAR